MFAEKRVGIVVAVLLLICALLLCNPTPVIEAKTLSTATVQVTPATISTTLTISAPSSAQVKQSFSITVQLTANGASLAKQRVSLQRLNGNTWTTLTSTTTLKPARDMTTSVSLTPASSQRPSTTTP